MTNVETLEPQVHASGIVEHREHGLLVLSPAKGKPIRRILYTNCSGGPKGWESVRNGLWPSNRFWGIPEMVQMGYEVAIAEPLPDFYFRRNAIPHDMIYFKMARSWLGRDGIVYCAHNVLYWLPFLKALGALKCNIVSLLYAREPLDWAKGHTGIIGMNPAATEHARKLAPKAKVADLGWGMDMTFYPQLPYVHKTILSCGRTNRDDITFNAAAAKSKAPIRLIAHSKYTDLKWSPNVEVIEGGTGWETRLPYHDLLHKYYGETIASVMVIKKDDIEYTACGFTGLLEAMAVGRAAIMTRTGAVPSGIDLDKEGCGIYVPPENPGALAEAMDYLANSPEKAKAMGEAGRKLCQKYYNMERYSRELHRFFETF